MTLEPVRCDDVATLERELAPVRAAGGAIAFVPTMGALHRGHLDLVARAAELAPTVVVSIFVNPTQFDVAGDLAAYPRTVEADLAALATVPGRARLLVYVPDVADVYPDGATTTIHVPDVTVHLCGATRPGHFDGVATVVDALLRRVRPTVAVFGRKDHQQLVVVRALVRQQGLDVRIEAAPTVRDDDGVAMSSRNARLDIAGRATARRIPRALLAAVGEAQAARDSGLDLDPAAVVAAARSVLVAPGGDPASSAELTIDYLELVDPERIVPLVGPQPAHATALLAVAVHVGGAGMRTRLIDNILLGDDDDERRLRDAVGEDLEG